MDCRVIKKSLYWLADGELGKPEEKAVREHLVACHICRQELKSIQEFQGILKAGKGTIEPSAGFEAGFWNKLTERQREPWLTRLLKELESLLPHPSMPQMAMVVLMAFLIGSTGGVVSAMNAPSSLDAERSSIQYLSGFHAFKGVASSSVAAGYLKIMEEGGSS